MTPFSLLTVAAKARWLSRSAPSKSQPAANQAEGPALRFCGTPTCHVVYFDACHAVVFGVNDVMVPVYQKDTEPARLVCYCFNHTVAAIEEQVTERGASTVGDSIAAACKAGLDQCREKNPQGGCCLGNVSAVVKAAMTRRQSAAAGAASEQGSAPSEERSLPGDCCGGPP